MENIDEVLSYHMEFLENCLKDCMLINQTLLKIITKLMMICVTFSNFIQVGGARQPLERVSVTLLLIVLLV